MQKGVFHQVPEPIEAFVVFTLNPSILFGWDDCLHTRLFGLRDNCVSIIATISKEVFGINAFNQMASLRAISPGTFCNKHSDRHTMRIHGQMHFCVEPPFVRAIS